MICYRRWSETCLNRTLSKLKTCLIQTDFTDLSTKCLCNLNLCKPNSCLNRTNSSFPKGFGLDRFYCIIFISLHYSNNTDRKLAQTFNSMSMKLCHWTILDFFIICISSIQTSLIRLIRSLKKFIFRYQYLVEIYSVSAEKIISDAFSYSENV